MNTPNDLERAGRPSAQKDAVAPAGGRFAAACAAPDGFGAAAGTAQASASTGDAAPLSDQPLVGGSR